MAQLQDTTPSVEHNPAGPHVCEPCRASFLRYEVAVDPAQREYDTMLAHAYKVSGLVGDGTEAGHKAFRKIVDPAWEKIKTIKATAMDRHLADTEPFHA